VSTARTFRPASRRSPACGRRRNLRLGEDHAGREPSVRAQACGLARPSEDVIGGEARLILAHVRQQHAAFASPTTYSHSWPGTRSCSSTSIDFPGWRPNCSRPSPSVWDVRPIATSSSSPVNVRRLKLERYRPPPSSRRTAVAFVPSTTSAPASSSASATWSEASSSSPAISRWSASTTVTFAPSEAVGRGHLRADDATAEHKQRSGDRFRGRHSRFVHGRASRRPGIGGIDAPSRSEDHGFASAQQLVADLDLALAGEDALPAHERDPAFLVPTASGRRLRGCARPRRDGAARRRRRAPRRGLSRARTRRASASLGAGPAAPSRACMA